MTFAKTFRSEKFLRLMRELPCANCGAEDGTVCAAHRNEGKGMAMKNSDALVAPLCFTCHAALDQGKDLTRQERRSMWNEAFISAVVRLIESGRLVNK